MTHRRFRTLDRLIALILRVQSGLPVPSLGDLAREHRCCERTIRRDLQAIETRLPVRRQGAA